jgi:hypothetical protein
MSIKLTNLKLEDSARLHVQKCQKCNFNADDRKVGFGMKTKCLHLL